MSEPNSDCVKLFTVEQANAALPLVRAIVKDLAELSREVIERTSGKAALACSTVNNFAGRYSSLMVGLVRSCLPSLVRYSKFVNVA